MYRKLYLNYNLGYLIFFCFFYFQNLQSRKLKSFDRSRQGYRRLFGIRENKFFNEELFNKSHFIENFLNQYNKKVLRRGEHVILLLNNLILFSLLSCLISHRSNVLI